MKWFCFGKEALMKVLFQILVWGIFVALGVAGTILVDVNTLLEQPQKYTHLIPWACGGILAAIVIQTALFLHSNRKGRMKYKNEHPPECAVVEDLTVGATGQIIAKADLTNTRATDPHIGNNAYLISFKWSQVTAVRDTDLPDWKPGDQVEVIEPDPFAPKRLITVQYGEASDASEDDDEEIADGEDSEEEESESAPSDEEDEEDDSTSDHPPPSVTVRPSDRVSA